MNIRQEMSQDYAAVFDLIRIAFASEPHSDHQEHHLVDRLRKSKDFIPELSFIAEIDGQIIGYLLLSKIQIISDSTTIDVLALAPVAVHPHYQKHGIGSSLIRHAHRKAQALGFDTIIVLGHEAYYPRFGYKKAKDYGIILPFDVPEENCMVLGLTENALNNKSGTVVYPKEFME